MFEVIYTITALVESDEQGKRVFEIYKHGEPANDDAFSSLLATVYQQEVYRTLKTGDSLTITLHLDLPLREIERTVRLREDEQFEGDGLQEPAHDLLPLLSGMYKQFLQDIHPGDVLTVTFRLERD